MSFYLPKNVKLDGMQLKHWTKMKPGDKYVARVFTPMQLREGRKSGKASRELFYLIIVNEKLKSKYVKQQRILTRMFFQE